jgi:hypothetical protein
MNSKPELSIRPEDDGSSTRVELTLDGKSISRLWITPFTLHVGEALVGMDGVGGVGTDEAHRSRGHSRRVIEAAIAHMGQGDAALSMLYGIRDFYPKFGYATAGPDYLAVLTDLELETAMPPGWSARPFAAGDLAAVQSLYATGTARSVGAARRPPDGRVWSKLRSIAADGKKDACRVVIGPDGAVHGYIWRARWCWYVKNALEPNFKQGLVLGEVMADSPNSADALLSACRLWAKEERLVRKTAVKEVVLAFPPVGPLACAAMRQDARLVRNYAACGGSMARVLSVPRLLDQLRPELEARLRAATCAFAGTLTIETDIGTAALAIDRARIKRTGAGSAGDSAPTVKLPQSELARLALGAFPPEDVLARLPESPPGAAAELLAILFPQRHPHMHLPDRY